jgi:hypothetical protein
MSTRTLRLSADELAYSFAQSGRADLAQGILQSTTDAELAAEDVLQRLLAAGHVLLARKLLSIAEDATPLLADDLRWVVNVLVAAPFSLRYTMATVEAQFVLTYHAFASGVVEHTIDQGVVHSITEHMQPREAVNGGVEFFRIAGLQNPLASQGEIAKKLLDEAQASDDVDAARKLLAGATLPSQLYDRLAEDLVHTTYRGTVLRIEYGPKGEPTSDRGLLLLGGVERLWILKPFQRPAGDFVTVIPGSEAIFRREVASLMK